MLIANLQCGDLERNGIMRVELLRMGLNPIKEFQPGRTQQEDSRRLTHTPPAFPADSSVWHCEQSAFVEWKFSSQVFCRGSQGDSRQAIWVIGARRGDAKISKCILVRYLVPLSSRDQLEMTGQRLEHYTPRNSVGFILTSCV